MTLVKGPKLNLPWTNQNGHQESTNAANKQDVIKGALMILAGSVGWSGFINLQFQFKMSTRTNKWIRLVVIGKFNLWLITTYSLVV